VQPRTPEDLPHILAGLPASVSLEVEIGCGNGHFLAEYGDKNRRSFLVGVEMKKKRCLKAAAKLEHRQLNNAVIIQGRAEALLAALPAGRVHGFHIYFPDPWPKTKHRKRRFLRLENLDRIHACLEQGGKVVFASDFFDYYLQVKILFLMHPGFVLADTGAPREFYLSVYAQRSQGLGKKIHSAVAMKSDEGASADQIMKQKQNQHQIDGQV
jgi:tRNA (guanine-N7-)-methyltransferase